MSKIQSKHLSMAHSTNPVQSLECLYFYTYILYLKHVRYRVTQSWISVIWSGACTARAYILCNREMWFNLMHTWVVWVSVLYTAQKRSRASIESRTSLFRQPSSTVDPQPHSCESNRMKLQPRTLCSIIAVWPHSRPISFTEVLSLL